MDHHVQPDHARAPLRSVDRALEVLEQLAGAHSPVSLTELSRRLGISKAGAYRLLLTLRGRGFVRQTDDAKYALGLRCWELGWAALGEGGVREAAATVMAELVGQTGESAHLAVYDRGEVVYVDKVESPRPVRAYSRIGGRAPAYCVATGKVLLAFAGEEEWERVARAGLRKFTSRTITTGAALREEMKRTIARGYSVNRGEWREEVFGIAAPIRDFSGSVIAAIGISGPSTHFTAAMVRSTIPRVCDAALEVSRRMGFVRRAAAGAPAARGE